MFLPMILKLLCRLSAPVACTVLFTAFSLSALAQPADSIRTVLSAYAKEDTTKVNLVTQLALTYQDGDPDSLLDIAGRGLALSGRIGSDRGRAVFSKLTGLAWYRKNEFDKAFAAYNTAFSLFTKVANPRGQSSALLSIADIYYRLAHYDTAIEYYNRGIAIGRESNNYINVGLGLTSIGGIYSDLGSYSEALQYYLKGLVVFEKVSYAPGISMSYTNLAAVYANLGNNARALDYISKCVAMGERTGNRESVLYNLVNASNVYAQMKDYRNCLSICKRALGLADTMGDNNWKNVCLNNLADAYYQLGYYDSAFTGFTRVLQKADSVKDVAMQAAAHKGLGLVAGKRGDIPVAVRELSSSFRIAKDNGIKESIMSGALDLGNIYEQAGDYRHAMEYHSIYYIYRDSVYSEKNNRHIQQLQFDYELDKKQKELERQATMAQARRQRNELIMWSLVAGVVLLVVIVILLYRSRRYERHNKERLMRQNKEIELQAEKLKDLNRFKDKTFSVLSHDLRGPVNSFTATMLLLNEHQMSTEEFDMLKPEITRQVSSLNLLLDNVLGWARGHMQEELPVKPVNTNIYHIANQNMTMLQGTAEQKDISMVNNISETTYAVCDEAQIDIVLRNLVMNAIKYTNRNGFITLTATAHEHTVDIVVADTGIGMTQAQLSNLFAPQQDSGNTYGTEGEKGIGLGLVLCYEFVKANKGTITVTSQVGKGSTFTVSLPRYKTAR